MLTTSERSENDRPNYKRANVGTTGKPDSVHTLETYYLEIHFNIALPARIDRRIVLQWILK
jgi:hypothetical protein